MRIWQNPMDLEIFAKYKGSSDFWMTDGDGQVPNKKKEAFLAFLKDSGVVKFDKKASGDKFTKCLPTRLADVVFTLGYDSPSSWALMLVNLSYTPAYNWFVNNLNIGEVYTPDQIKLMLTNVMDGDAKGLGKRNVVDALKIVLTKTPLGKNKIFASFDAKEKKSSSGQETITLNSLQRVTWENPDPVVILFSLYRFAEECDGYYQFTLSRLLDHEIESNGISPTKLFGLSREQMEKILTGLSINYPDYINASFTLDLDNITLRAEKTSEDILGLYIGE